MVYLETEMDEFLNKMDKRLLLTPVEKDMVCSGFQAGVASVVKLIENEISELQKLDNGLSETHGGRQYPRDVIQDKIVGHSQIISKLHKGKEESREYCSNKS
jgi:hypothetical protein